MKTIILSVLWSCGWAGSALAQLSWASTSLTLYPAPQATTVAASYAFTNTGRTPITITQVKTSCDCTSAQLAQPTYAPGAAGTIAVTFQPRPRSGTQEKYLQVLSDDPAQPAVELTLRVVIPAVVDLEPGYITWRQGEAPTPKTIAIIISQPQPVQLTLVPPADATPAPAAFAYALTTVEPGRRYELRVTPQQTAAIAKEAVTLQTDFTSTTGGEAFRYTAFAGVLPAAPAATQP